MTRENKNDWKFYTCLVMAFGLMLTSLFMPPVNVITTSVLYASIIILSLGGLTAGIDLEGILKEMNELKRIDAALAKREYEQKQCNNTDVEVTSEKDCDCQNENKNTNKE